MLVISMYGNKMTKRNVIRTGVFSANLVSRDMPGLMDYFGSHHAKDGKKDGVPYEVSRGDDISRTVHNRVAIRGRESYIKMKPNGRRDHYENEGRIGRPQGGS